MPFKVNYGIQVDRAAAADPQSAWQTLFTITGGWVIIRALFGIRTVIQAGGASTMQFRHSVGTTALDAGTLSIAGDTVGTIYSLTGDPTDPIQSGVGGIRVPMGKVVATSLTHGSPNGVCLLFTGNVQVTMTAAAGTGSTSYSIIYTPITAGAAIVAV